MAIISILIALLCDWLIGDPYSWPHPVKWIGSYIQFCLSLYQKRRIPPYVFGFLLWGTTVGLAVTGVWLVLWLALRVHPIVYWVISIYLAYASLATRSLAVEALKVYRTLKTGTIEEARYQVSMIVGRDTAELTHSEITKATIETVAENTSDGVIGPLLCLLLGGPVLAIAYKAINTLDSMVGYKTEKYRQIGYISAKIDDLANLVPARVTWVCLMLASHVLQLNAKDAYRIGVRDRYQHASPNSAFSEAVVAGALGIQLGGAHIYHGELIEKPTIGDATREVVAEDIVTTVSLLYMSTMIALIAGVIVSLILSIL
ncbi:adenosylcobinamide-phosphate synthase CbiB [Streptococcus merionis]|uniref:Cobalamin biosynthesis protein CobD n=1 Tax=Streptococcus merionis TaxID=400065 RepID=A0A239SMU3_9STRE|nr:adenosylcobinamide-phosphate synthase CbiB [Streptococcus merionis]SNU86727.1 cobalamin biosynthesis protein cobD [Streptococcus merionis]